MVTIETILGCSQELDEKSIIYLLVEKVARKVPAITANFLMNAEGRYIVVESPKNLVELILNTAVQQEYEKAWLYVEEIKEQNEKAKEKLDSYKLGRLQQEEDAKKAPLELILEGFVRSGMPVSFMLSTYREKGLLYPNQQKNLLGLLKIRKFEENALADLEGVLEGGEFIDPERTWKILTEQYNVRVPVQEIADEAHLREVPPLREELEAVVMAACKRQPLEGVAISSDVWAEIGIDASAAYRKIAESVLQLNNNYFLVKATGIGESAGAISVVEFDESKNALKSGTPKQLRGNLRLPTEIVNDFYKLCIVLAHTYTHEIDDNPDLSELPYDEKIGVSMVILERLLKGKTDLAISIYPEVSSEKVEEHREKYGSIVEAVATRIENGEGDYAHFKLGNTVVVSASEVQGVMNYLADLVPEELYLLRKMWIMMQVPKEYKRNIDRAERDGKVLKGGQHQEEEIDSLLQDSKAIYGEISAYLLHLAEGAGRWPLKTPHELDFKVIEFYGLNLDHQRATAKILARNPPKNAMPP